MRGRRNLDVGTCLNRVLLIRNGKGQNMWVFSKIYSNGNVIII